MASPRLGSGGGRQTDLSLTARVVSGMQDIWDGWFGPGVPMLPVAPPDEVAGRQFDFPFGINTIATRPKQEASETGVSFALLRQIAEPGQGGLDLLRIAIETRKDQMAAQRWTLRGRKADDDGGDRARNIEAALRRPDGIRDFHQWLRMLLEDHMVLDAVAVYPRQLAGRPVFDVIDGATIKLLIDEKGRTPLSPMPAYQQILKGLPAIDYTVNELRYYPYNVRTNRLYGLSRVEQVINIVNLGLRRQLHVLQFYTEGTIPDALIGVPENWNPDQIKSFQTYWDLVLEGNTGQRRHAKFIPGGMKPEYPKSEILKDEFDDWLARVICFCFSLSPQALAKQMNRATSQTAKESSIEEGLEPMKLYAKNVIDDLIAIGFDAPDLELAWTDEEISDPAVKADVTMALTGGKPIIDINEGRKMWGFAPKTPAQIEEMNPTPPPPVVPGDDEDDPAEPLIGKAGRHGRRGSLPEGYPRPRSKA